MSRRTGRCTTNRQRQLTAPLEECEGETRAAVTGIERSGPDGFAPVARVEGKAGPLERWQMEGLGLGVTARRRCEGGEEAKKKDLDGDGRWQGMAAVETAIPFMNWGVEKSEK